MNGNIKLKHFWINITYSLAPKASNFSVKSFSAADLDRTDYFQAEKEAKMHTEFL